MTYLDPKKVKYIAIHCSATLAGMNIGVKEIREWHTLPPPKGRGWSDVGYHKIIRRLPLDVTKGLIEDGRPLDVIGAHVEGYNHCSIGICLVGGCKKGDNGKLVPENNFTVAQFDCLHNLLSVMEYDFPDAIIQGHRDFPNVHKDCPSFDVKEWLKANPI